MDHRRRRPPQTGLCVYEIDDPSIRFVPVSCVRQFVPNVDLVTLEMIQTLIGSRVSVTTLPSSKEWFARYVVSRIR